MGSKWEMSGKGLGMFRGEDLGCSSVAVADLTSQKVWNNDCTR